ncbi:MAG: hypothetical protein IKR68_06550, partial [Lachnospiraceae bacterium]|nr:hypothetical protein [Lachnospiraceae bacterium]
MRSISFRRSIAIILAAVMTVSGAMSTFAADDNITSEASEDTGVLISEDTRDEETDMISPVTDEEYVNYDGSLELVSYNYYPDAYGLDFRMTIGPGSKPSLDALGLIWAKEGDASFDKNKGDIKTTDLPAGFHITPVTEISCEKIEKSDKHSYYYFTGRFVPDCGFETNTRYLARIALVRKYYSYSQIEFSTSPFIFTTTKAGVDKTLVELKNPQILDNGYTVAHMSYDIENPADEAIASHGFLIEKINGKTLDTPTTIPGSKTDSDKIFHPSEGFVTLKTDNQVLSGHLYADVFTGDNKEQTSKRLTYGDEITITPENPADTEVYATVTAGAVTATLLWENDNYDKNDKYTDKVYYRKKGEESFTCIGMSLGGVES